MTIPEIKKMLCVKTGIDPQEMSFLSHFSGSNQLFKLKYGKSIYVLKIFKAKYLFDRELYALFLLSQQQLKCPVIYSYDDGIKNWILYKYIPGVNLNEAIKTSTNSQLKVIFEDLGNELSGIHAIKTNINDVKDFKERQQISTEHTIAEILNKLNENTIIKAVNRIRNQYFLYNSISNLSIVHNDLNSSNIIVKKNKIASIIDYDQSCYGISFHDFLCIKHLLSNRVLENAFLRGYKNIEPDLFNELTNHFILIDALKNCNFYYHKNHSIYNYYFEIINQLLKN